MTCYEALPWTLVLSINLKVLLFQLMDDIIGHLVNPWDHAEIHEGAAQ